MYRDAYLKLMAAPAQNGDLGLASTGDQAALHRFLLRAETFANQPGGEFSETYAYDLRFLLLRIGDASFAAGLRRLTPKQRMFAAENLNISREREWFPLTTSCLPSYSQSPKRLPL